MALFLTSITFSIWNIAILKSLSECLIISNLSDLDSFMSPVLILLARILSIQYLPISEFWCTGSFQEGSWFLSFFASSLSLHLARSSRESLGRGQHVVLSLSFCLRGRASRHCLASIPWVPPPVSSGRLGFCCPPGPLPAQHSWPPSLCRASCWCSATHTKRWLFVSPVSSLSPLHVWSRGAVSEHDFMEAS